MIRMQHITRLATLLVLAVLAAGCGPTDGDGGSEARAQAIDGITPAAITLLLSVIRRGSLRQAS